MKLDRALDNVLKLGLDTSPIIYFIEASTKYAKLLNPIFQRMSTGGINAITSTITLAEVLVHPYLEQDYALAQKYRDFLLRSNGLDVLAVGPLIADTTAKLRAEHQLKTPDAIQLAAAISSGCTAFLTNDTRLKRVTHLSILVLDELEP